MEKDKQLDLVFLEKFWVEYSGLHFDRLPTCPSCLESLDSSCTGLLPSPTDVHVPAWDQLVCFVCRRDKKHKLRCSECQSDKNLWVCMICGHVACGRYHQRHAVLHNEELMHQFALEIDSQRIWNYFSDNYVHRVLRSQLPSYQDCEVIDTSSITNITIDLPERQQTLS
jgi:hypothetical protein